MKGVGVLIGLLGGNDESAKAFGAAIGKKITALELKDDALHFKFEDGTGIRLFDDGQSCCESRYMRTDDDLSAFVGADLRGAETRPGPEAPHGEYDEEHEIEFLVVSTSLGEFTMASHNEHNGYYGGFCIRCAMESPDA